jgi:hypothetical protein
MCQPHVEQHAAILQKRGGWIAGEIAFEGFYEFCG